MRIKKGETMAEARERSGPVGGTELLKRQMHKPVSSYHFVEVVPYYSTSVDGNSHSHSHSHLKQDRAGAGAGEVATQNKFDVGNIKKLDMNLGFPDATDCSILVRSEGGLEDADSASLSRTFVKARSGNCLWRLGAGQVCRSDSLNPSCRGYKLSDSSSTLGKILQQSCSLSIPEKKICHSSTFVDAASSSKKPCTGADCLQSDIDLQTRSARNLETGSDTDLKTVLQGKTNYHNTTTDEFWNLKLLADVTMDWIRQEVVMEVKRKSETEETKGGFFIHGGCRFSQKAVKRVGRKNGSDCDESKGRKAKSVKQICREGTDKNSMDSNKRRRATMLPGKFQDSVLSPWKKKTRK